MRTPDCISTSLFHQDRLNHTFSLSHVWFYCKSAELASFLSQDVGDIYYPNKLYQNWSGLVTLRIELSQAITIFNRLGVKAALKSCENRYYTIEVRL